MTGTDPFVDWEADPDVTQLLIRSQGTYRLRSHLALVLVVTGQSGVYVWSVCKLYCQTNATPHPCPPGCQPSWGLLLA